MPQDKFTRTQQLAVNATAGGHSDSIVTNVTMLLFVGGIRDVIQFLFAQISSDPTIRVHEHAFPPYKTFKLCI
jgi:hypothetical protein